MLAPALSVVLLLFGSGLLLAVLQSFGYLPFIGRTTLTLDAYRDLLGSRAFYQSLGISLWVAGVSTLLATLLGLAVALLLRRPFSGRRRALFLFQLNLPIPHLVGGVGILLLLGQSGLLARAAYAVGLIAQPADFPALIYDRFAIGIIAEYLWKETVFIALVLLGALRTIGDEWEQAAATLGASAWQRFRHVLLPLLRPSLRAASILIFAFSFGAFEIPYLLGQRFPSALPVVAYRRYTDVDLAARAEAMAIAVMLSLVSLVLIVIYGRWTTRAAV